MVKNLGILGSTRGSDLPAIVESINNGELKGLAKIAVVISDKKDAGILEKARNYGLEWFFMDPKDYSSPPTFEPGGSVTVPDMSRGSYDLKLAKKLNFYNIDLIVEIGYMRLHIPEFVREFKHRIMNVHPSLLPSFSGIDRSVHQEVLDYGCKVSGCTIHFIDEGKDTGPIIIQGVVPVLEGDTVDALKEKVQAKEQELYPKAIKLYCEGRLKVEGRKVHILGNEAK